MSEILYEAFGGTDQVYARSRRRFVRMNDGVLLYAPQRQVSAVSHDAVVLRSPRRSVRAMTGDSAAVLRSPRRSAYLASAAAPANLSLVYALAPARGFTGGMRVRHIVEGDMVSPRRSLLAGTGDLALLRAPRRFVVAMQWVAPTSYISIEMPPGIAAIASGAPRIEDDAYDTLVLADATQDSVTWTFASALLLSSVSATAGVFTSNAGDNLALTDAARNVVTLVAGSVLTLADAPAATLHALLSAASTLQLSDQSLDALSAMGVAASLFVLLSEGAAARLLSDEAESALTFTDEANNHVRALVAALDTLELSDTTTARMFAFGTVADTVSFADATAGILSGNFAVFDTLVFTGVVRWLGDPYSVYSVSLDNQAVTEYENYDFNSFAVINGEAYGMGAAGIYKLEGADDAGAPINSRVRTGLNNLGTALKKRVPNVYVGYTTTGVLALKVVTTDSGVKKANYYTLRPLPKSEVTDNRFDVAKGLSSVYWQFEIANEDGAGFELDEVRAWRMLTNRRK